MGIVEEKTRKEIALLRPYMCARQTVAQGVLLNANENCFGPAAEEFAGLLGVELNRYPDPRSKELCRKYADYAGVASENIVAGNGSDELIDLAIRVFAGNGDEVVDAPPTFEMYDVFSKAAGAEVVAVGRDEEFRADFDNLKKAVGPRTKIVFLASPNNPSGNACSRKELLDFASGVDCMFFVDEAYYEFCGKSVAKDAAEMENLVVFRTLSKAWGLAGLRTGFMIGSEKVVELVLKIKPPYNVDAVSQRIAAATLKTGRKRMEEFVRLIVNERKRLEKRLAEETNWKIFSSDANFLLCRLPPEQDAAKVFKQLRENGVVVRDFSQRPGLENCLRITVGKLEENELLMQEIGELEKNR